MGYPARAFAERRGEYCGSRLERTTIPGFPVDPIDLGASGAPRTIERRMRHTTLPARAVALPVVIK